MDCLKINELTNHDSLARMFRLSMFSGLRNYSLATTLFGSPQVAGCDFVRTGPDMCFSSRFSAKNRGKNGPSGPCKGSLEKRALALVADSKNYRLRDGL